MDGDDTFALCLRIMAGSVCLRVGGCSAGKTAQRRTSESKSGGPAMDGTWGMDECLGRRRLDSPRLA